MTLPWWTGLPPAQATLTCGEQTHRLIWENGTLAAADHADPDGERALAALGGEPLPCIAMLDAWRAHVEDPNVLLLGSRGPTDLIKGSEQQPNWTAPGARAAAMRRSGASFAVTTRLAQSPRPLPAPRQNDEDQLARLLSLGGGLGRRLDATVAAHWRDRLLDPDAEDDHVRSRLQAALYGRVLATLIAWLGENELALTLELTPDGTPPLLQRGADGEIIAALPFGWLTEVWAKGLEVVWGRFCLAVTTADTHSWELHTVGPGLERPTTLTVTL
jgi:hypothetical protein